MNYSNAVMILSVISMLFYITSGIFEITHRTRLSKPLIAVGMLSNAIILAIHWYVNGYPPFANIYQLLFTLSFVLAIMDIILSMLNTSNKWFSVYFRFFAAVPLLGTCFMDNEITWALVPALKSVWFVPHVLSYIIGYSIAAIAFILSIRYFIFREQRKKSYDAAVTLVRISVPFMVNGMTLGAIWADQIWGAFWQWDIKEIWSLITCVVYLCGLHISSGKYRTVSNILFIIGFICLVVTFLFVNVLPSGESLHTY